MDELKAWQDHGNGHPEHLELPPRTQTLKKSLDVDG